LHFDIDDDDEDGDLYDDDNNEIDDNDEDGDLYDDDDNDDDDDDRPPSSSTSTLLGGWQLKKEAIPLLLSTPSMKASARTSAACSVIVPGKLCSLPHLCLLPHLCFTVVCLFVCM